MSLVSNEGKEGIDRVLCILERVFGIALCMFLVLTLLGQVILSTPKGRSGLSRIERLEGIRLDVDAGYYNDSN